MNRSPSENGLRDDHLLPVAELLHRVRNEYTRLICLASAIAAKSYNKETKAALSHIITQMHSTAEVHRVLSPPLGEGLADLTEVLSLLRFDRFFGVSASRYQIRASRRASYPDRCRAMLACESCCRRAYQQFLPPCLRFALRLHFRGSSLKGVGKSEFGGGSAIAPGGSRLT